MVLQQHIADLSGICIQSFLPGSNSRYFLHSTAAALVCRHKIRIQSKKDSSLRFYTLLQLPALPLNEHRVRDFGEHLMQSHPSEDVLSAMQESPVDGVTAQ